jgi:hypothetical protein
MSLSKRLFWYSNNCLHFSKFHSYLQHVVKVLVLLNRRQVVEDGLKLVLLHAVAHLVVIGVKLLPLTHRQIMLRVFLLKTSLWFVRKAGAYSSRGLSQVFASRVGYKPCHKHYPKQPI